MSDPGIPDGYMQKVANGLYIWMHKKLPSCNSLRNILLELTYLRSTMVCLHFDTNFDTLRLGFQLDSHTGNYDRISIRRILT